MQVAGKQAGEGSDQAILSNTRGSMWEQVRIRVARQRATMRSSDQEAITYGFFNVRIKGHITLCSKIQITSLASMEGSVWSWYAANIA